MSTVPKLLTIADLTTRWKMSRQGIHDKKKENSFPNPIQYVANGRTALYLESDIEAYEQEHPWISSPARRERRQRFIFNLINKYVVISKPSEKVSAACSFSSFTGLLNGFTLWALNLCLKYNYEL